MAKTTPCARHFQIYTTCKNTKIQNSPKYFQNLSEAFKFKEIPTIKLKTSQQLKKGERNLSSYRHFLPILQNCLTPQASFTFIACLIETGRE